MSELVDPAKIEALVGTSRNPKKHLGRADWDEKVVYILHSRECVDSGIDLRECEYSKALDLGIDEKEWIFNWPVPLKIDEWGMLIPGTGSGWSSKNA